MIDREDLEKDLKKVADAVGGNPSRKQYNNEGEYSVKTFENRFGGWIEAKQQILGEAEKNITETQLISDLQAADQQVDGELSVADYRELGVYSPDTAIRRFGKWNQAKTAAGVK